MVERFTVIGGGHESDASIYMGRDVCTPRINSGAFVAP